MMGSRAWRVITLVAGLCVASYLPTSQAIYDASSPVKVLNAVKLANALEKRGVLLVEFFAPWCGHCKNLAPEWEKVAGALNGLLTVVAVDADAEKSVGAQYKVEGFPTIKLLVARPGGKPARAVEYKGGRTAAEIVSWAMQQATKVSQDRLGGKQGGKKTAGGSGGTGARDSSSFYAGTGVVELNDDTFHSTLASADTPFFVEFYAPWCGHCKALKPSWVDLAGRLAGRVGVAAVDCTAAQQTCSEFGVQGFPTLKWFGSGEGTPEAYEGGRDVEELLTFATQRWAASAPPPEVQELVDQHSWEEHCVGHDVDAELGVSEVKAKQLCIVAFLPHILDSGVEGRNAAIQILRNLAEKFKDRPFSFLWAAGGAQPALEANFGVGGYGYPALIAANMSKGKFASLRSAFEDGHVQEFIHAVRTGQERVEPLVGEPAVLSTTTPWDGEAGSLDAEDEFSLDDLMGKDEL